MSKVKVYMHKDIMASERAGLHGYGAAQDSIPREYHRKILKKIAQLTKVIYTLNTKNDENEQFVARLKATHEEDRDAILSDCMHKLQRCEDRLALDKDVAEKQIISLRESLLTVERERNSLHEDQSSYRKTVEDKIGGLRAQHSANVQTLTQQLEKLKSEQAQQLKELSRVRADFSKTSSKQAEELEQRYKVKMVDLQETLEKEFSRERSALKEDHIKEKEHLKAELEEQKRAHEIVMMKCSDETAEKRNLEERENTMRREFSQKEEQLKQQLSTLSSDLRTTRDKLAVSERRVEDLLVQFEDSKSSSADVQGRLREYEQEVELLNSALRESRNELEISREHYQQQSTEMKEMAANLGKLEARAVSNKGTIEKLRSQVEGLQLKTEQLEKERDLLEASRNDTTAHTSAQIMSLQEELDKMRREKQEIRVQYAREIEAAQAQMSESEIQLKRQHLAAIRQLQEDSKQAALASTRDRDAALEELTKKLQSQQDEELLQLKQRLEGENSRLQDNLSDRTSELKLAQAELKMLEAELTKREKGLGSAATSLDRIREELRAVKGDLTVTHREKQEAVKEKEKLMVTVDDLRVKIRDTTKTHQEHLVELTKELTEKLEKKWKEKLTMECGALRQELSTRHREDSKAALSELSELHKRDMETARKGWEVEKDRLSRRIFDLEKKLQETKNLNSAQLDEAKTSSDHQIEALRQELQEQDACHADAVKQQTQLHRQELEVMGKRLTAEREELVGHLEEKHQQKQLDLQQANQIAVEALRRMLEQQNQQMADQLRSEYNTKMADQQVELMAEYERDKKSLYEEGELEIRRYQDQMNIMIANRRNEVSQYEKTVSDLKADVEYRDAELSKLRDKANSLTVGVNKLRKELEVKGHELSTARRESNTILQQRERELSAAHDVEIESLSTQYKHQSQMMLSQFNNAKSLFVKKTTELESQVREWEKIYRARDSRPEDVEAIRELRLLVEQQRQKIKDLMAEKKVYQLELNNREKNYNQVFSANPHIGVLNPLAGKQQKKPKLSDMGHHFSSAPSLFTSSVTEPHTPSPMASTSGPLYPTPASSSSSSIGQLSSMRGDQQQQAIPAAQVFTRREQPLPAAAKPKKLAMLRDSPLSRHKVPPHSRRENGTDTIKGDGFGLPLKPLDPISTVS